MSRKERERAVATTPSVIATRETYHSGPLPSAAELARYDSVLPGLANRIVTMAEDQTKHRLAIEAKVVGGNVRAQLLGQIFGFVLGLGGLGIGAWLIAADKVGMGVATIGIESIALAGVFVTGRIIQYKERKGRQIPPDTGNADSETVARPSQKT